jgi:hypothetical protein
VETANHPVSKEASAPVGTYVSTPHPGGEQASLHRAISWKGAIWAASGVPALVLFNIGALASTGGQPAWLIWIVSILMGFIQCFTYAEIAGLFPHQSGGTSVHGAIAWARYSKFIVPISVWCNWYAVARARAQNGPRRRIHTHSHVSRELGHQHLVAYAPAP